MYYYQVFLYRCLVFAVLGDAMSTVEPLYCGHLAVLGDAMSTVEPLYCGHLAVLGGAMSTVEPLYSGRLAVLGDAICLQWNPSTVNILGTWGNPV